MERITLIQRDNVHCYHGLSMYKKWLAGTLTMPSNEFYIKYSHMCSRNPMGVYGWIPIWSPTTPHGNDQSRLTCCSNSLAGVHIQAGIGACPNGFIGIRGVCVGMSTSFLGCFFPNLKKILYIGYRMKCG